MARDPGGNAARRLRVYEELARATVRTVAAMRELKIDQKGLSREAIYAAVCAVRDVVRDQDAVRKPLLHLSNSIEHTRALLAAGADPNARDEIGQTALHVASSAAQTQALLNAGADPNARANEGHTPLHEAWGEQTEDLLAAGADPNARDCNGSVPLHEASSPAQIEALLNAGADPTVRDNEGHTPLDLALARGDDKQSELLREAMAPQADPAPGQHAEPRPGPQIDDDYGYDY